MRAFAVKDWDEVFMKRDIAKRNTRPYWIALPTKMSGRGFSRLKAIDDEQRKCRLFSAWILIAQVASQMPQRGILADEDGPLTPEDMHYITGFSQDIFDDAFEYFSTTPKIKWLIPCEYDPENNRWVRVKKEQQKHHEINQTRQENKAGPHPENTTECGQLVNNLLITCENPENSANVAEKIRKNDGLFYFQKTLENNYKNDGKNQGRTPAGHQPDTSRTASGLQDKTRQDKLITEPPPNTALRAESPDGGKNYRKAQPDKKNSKNRLEVLFFVGKKKPVGITARYWNSVVNRFGGDADRAAELFTQAEERANEPKRWIEKGMSERWVFDPPAESLKKELVQSWITKNISPHLPTWKTGVWIKARFIKYRA